MMYRKKSYRRKVRVGVIALAIALMCGLGASAAFAATQDVSSSSGAAVLSDASSSASAAAPASSDVASDVPAVPGAAPDAGVAPDATPDANVVKSGDSFSADDEAESTEPVEVAGEEGSELSALAESPIEEVRALIQGLSANPKEYTAGDRAHVEAIAAAFDALDEDDRATLDAECSHPETNQSLGRVLEIALWAVWSYGEVDDFTTLTDGTYSASTSTALCSEYSKGKSTSPRVRPWHVKSVQVAGNKATATITVESSTYTHLWMGGVLYEDTAFPDGWTKRSNGGYDSRKSGYCEFSGVPIDLNSTFYFAGVSTSMPIPIAFSLTTEIDEPPMPVHEVTFTDGFGAVLDVQQVEHGMSAVEPAEPQCEGWRFVGWDTPFDYVTSDLTVNALWEDESINYYVVTFDANGGKFDDGSATAEVRVEEGGDATAPANPTRRGYVFTGWDPAVFGNVTKDRTVTAQWISEDKATANAVRDMIAKLPEDPKAIIGKTDNEAVSKAGQAYNVLTDDQKALLSDDDKLKLVRSLIAVLPKDPFDVTADDSTAIKTAQDAYDSLAEKLQKQLDSDSDPLAESRSYGRYLESAVWALDSLRTVNNITLLKSGTYTKGFTSSSTRGKSTSKRDTTLTVKSVKVENGRAIATVECSGSSYQTLLLGGKKYENVQTEAGGKPLFEIPINLNSTFHVSLKSKDATDDTDGVAFEMTVSADESSMKPDPEQGEDPGNGGNPGGSGDNNGGNGGNNGNQNNGSNQGSGSQTALNPTGVSGTGASGANLSSMLRTSSATGTSTTGSGAASNATANASKTGSTAGKNGSTSSTANLPISDQAGGSVIAMSEDLAPAIAGGLLLCASLGALAFALLFVRRENRLGL